MQVEDAIWPYPCSWLHANVHLPVLPSHFVYKETTRFAFFQVQLQQYGRVCVAIRVVNRSQDHRYDSDQLFQSCNIARRSPGSSGVRSQIFTARYI